MYKIKQIPEDFVVEEITSIKPEKQGNYTYFWLKKHNYNTIRAIQHIAKHLKIPEKNIGFAGNKDKIAITKQLISIKKENTQNLKLKDISLEFFGKGKEPISLGNLEENKFAITVRNITNKPKTINKIPNLFGEQRFSKNNAEIGKSIIKKDFKKTIQLILETSPDFKEQINSLLKSRPNDHIGALRLIPKRLLRLYIHSYQSLIWNKTISQYLKTNPKTNIQIPIIGFGTELENNNLSKIIKSIIEKENITERDFIIQQLPELSSEGSERSLFTEIKNLEISDLEKDELNKGKNKCIIKFSLKKGSYATVAIKSIIHQ